MRLRATLAGMLIVMLVAFSSAASACTIKCDFFMAASGCHAGSKSTVAHRTSMAAMPGMDGADMAAQHEPSEPAAFSDAYSCGHAACAQQPGLVRDQKVSFVPAPTGIELFAFDPRQLILDPVARGLSVRGPPLCRTDSPVSRHTTIRI